MKDEDLKNMSLEELDALAARINNLKQLEPFAATRYLMSTLFRMYPGDSIFFKTAKDFEHAVKVCEFLTNAGLSFVYKEFPPGGRIWLTDLADIKALAPEDNPFLIETDIPLPREGEEVAATGKAESRSYYTWGQMKVGEKKEFVDYQSFRRAGAAAYRWSKRNPTFEFTQEQKPDKSGGYIIRIA